MIYCPYCGNETDWMTVQMAHRVLDVSTKTVRKWLREGRFDGAVKVPGVNTAFEWKIPVASVLPLVKEK